MRGVPKNPYDECATPPICDENALARGGHVSESSVQSSPLVVVVVVAVVVVVIVHDIILHYIMLYSIIVVFIMLSPRPTQHMMLSGVSVMVYVLLRCMR